jgi:hypothetical protein
VLQAKPLDFEVMRAKNAVVVAHESKRTASGRQTSSGFVQSNRKMRRILSTQPLVGGVAVKPEHPCRFADTQDDCRMVAQAD